MQRSAFLRVPECLKMRRVSLELTEIEKSRFHAMNMSFGQVNCRLAKRKDSSKVFPRRRSDISSSLSEIPTCVVAKPLHKPQLKKLYIPARKLNAKKPSASLGKLKGVRIQASSSVPKGEYPRPARVSKLPKLPRVHVWYLLDQPQESPIETPRPWTPAVC